jgi:hypothetical protein
MRLQAQSTERQIVGIPREKQHENRRLQRRDWTSKEELLKGKNLTLRAG